MPLVAILFEKPTIIVHLLVCALSGLVYSQWSFLLPLYLDNIYGASNGGASFFGLMTSINGLVVIVSTPVITFLFRKHKHFYKIILGIFMYSISYLFLIPHNKIMFIIMIVLFTVGEVTHSVGARPYLASRVPSTHRARVTSYENVFYSIGYATSSLIVGMLLESISFTSVFIILFIVGTLVCLVEYANYWYDRSSFPKLYEK